MKCLRAFLAGSFVAVAASAPSAGDTGPGLAPSTTPATIPATAPARAPLDSVTAITAAILPRLEELRGLRFRQPVPVRVETDSVARAYFTARAERDTPPESLRVFGRAASLLGLLPAGFDLETALLDLLEEQAGGYYDPERKIFVVLGDMPQGAARSIIAHELTHALDDQHFNLDSLMTTTRGDDEDLALAGLVEGGATAVMARFIAEQFASGRMSAEEIAAVAESDAGRAERLQAAPVFLQRMLVAPYVVGMNFVLRGNPMALMALNSDDLNAAFRRPPRSSEQILHPEKYWDAAQTDAPRAVPALDAAQGIGPDWQVEGSGVLGELALAVLTEKTPVPILELATAAAARWTNAAAAGWGGDHWWLLRDGAHEAVVLVTVWDTEKDAREFAAAARADGRELQRAGSWVVLVAGDAAVRAALGRSTLKFMRTAAGR